MESRYKASEAKFDGFIETINRQRWLWEVTRMEGREDER